MKQIRTLPLLVLVLVLVGVVLTPACGAPPSPPAPVGSVPGTVGAAVDPWPHALASTRWVFVSFEEGGKVWAVPDGLRARLRFGPGGGYAADLCNEWSGSTYRTGDTLVFGENAVTAMACWGEQAHLDRAGGSVLVGRVDWSLVDGELRLRTANTMAVLRPEA